MTSQSASPALGNAEIIEFQILPLRMALAAGDSEGYPQPQVEADLTDLSSTERVILSEALFDEQVLSKLWLLDQLFKWGSFNDAKILVLGGWCAVLPWLAHLSGRGTPATWVSIDFDAAVDSIGRRAFGKWVPNLSFECRNIFDLNYQQLAQEQPLVVINTICEHLSAFDSWRSMLPESVMTVLQSNNYRGCRDHVNCVDSVEELVAKARLTELLFAGSLPVSLFTRFMVVGRT